MVRRQSDAAPADPPKPQGKPADQKKVEDLVLHAEQNEGGQQQDFEQDNEPILSKQYFNAVTRCWLVVHERIIRSTANEINLKNQE
jgi:hypothetical protein